MFYCLVAICTENFTVIHLRHFELSWYGDTQTQANAYDRIMSHLLLSDENELILFCTGLVPGTVMFEQLMDSSSLSAVGGLRWICSCLASRSGTGSASIINGGETNTGHGRKPAIINLEAEIAVRSTGRRDDAAVGGCGRCANRWEQWRNFKFCSPLRKTPYTCPPHRRRLS